MAISPTHIHVFLVLYGDLPTHVHVFLVLYGDVHGVGAVVERVLPGVQQVQKPDLPSAVGLQRVLDCHEVLQRLRHLAALDSQVARMEEVPHPAVMAEIGLERNKKIK